PSPAAAFHVPLCDGSQGAALDAQWQIGPASSNVTPDSARAYRGKASLHLHTDAAPADTDPGSGLFESRTFPQSTTLYLRVWAFFPSPFPGAFDQLINFIDAQGGGIAYAIKNGFPVLNAYTQP